GSRVAHQRLTNAWLKRYILETFSLPCSILVFSTLLNRHSCASARNLGSCLSSLFTSLLSGWLFSLQVDGPGARFFKGLSKIPRDNQSRALTFGSKRKTEANCLRQ